MMIVVSEDRAEESCGELNGRNNDSVICDANCCKWVGSMNIVRVTRLMNDIDG